MKLLIINPGSTSTKLSLYEDRKELFTDSVFHDAPVLLQYPTVNEQVPFRIEVIDELLKKHGASFDDVDVYVGRGGSAYSQREGVIRIDKRLYDDTWNEVGGGDHASKLGVLVAYTLCTRYADRQRKPEMYTLNAINIDELWDLSRITGIKGVYIDAQSHALNQKAIAKIHAKKIGREYADCNFIVCHIDGGISIGAHRRGVMVDGNSGASGDGPFSPTRLGSVPVLKVLQYLEDGHTTTELRKMCSRAGGFVSHFGTSSSDKIHALVEQGDKMAALVWNTMIYQICKSIGSMSVVLEGKVDNIILTGGLVRFDDIVQGIRQRTEWIAPLALYPGEAEQEELCFRVLDALEGREEVHTYTGHPVFEGF